MLHNTIKALIPLAVVLLLSSCANSWPTSRPAQNLHVSSMRDRSILGSIKFTPRGRHVVELMMSPYDDLDFARFKTALGVSDDHVYARGYVQLILSAKSNVERVEGSFEVQIGTHLGFPEWRKVPTNMHSRKLTMDILSRLAAKGLL